MKKSLKKLCLLSAGAYALFFVGGAVLYPKIKITDKVQDAKNKTFDDQPFFNIHDSDEKVSVFSSRDQALDLRCELIDHAKKELWITQYAIENDDSGDLFIQHILQAANRGVKVHLIGNGMAMKWKLASFYKKLALVSHKNIEFRIYGGLNLLKPWTINNVMHDKLIIVDDEYFVSSGRNVGDRFMLGREKDKQTYDMDIVVKAFGSRRPIIEAGKQYFHQIWTSPYTKQGLAFEKWISQSIATYSQNKTMENHSELEKTYHEQMAPKTLASLDYAPVKRARLLHNDPHENIKTPYIWESVSSLLNNQKNMTLQTPYLVLTNSMLKYLQLDKLENHKPTVLTNSEATSPNLLAFTGYMARKAEDLQWFHIQEYQGNGSIHNKGFIYDDHIMAVGSFNTDPRSTFLDSENLLVIDSKEATKQLEGVMKHYEKESLTCQSPTTYVKKEGVATKLLPDAKATLMRWVSKIISPFSYLT